MMDNNNIEVNNGQRLDILALMPPRNPADHYLTHVIEGIETLVRLEASIPTVWSHRKIEWGYRLFCQRIQTFDRERKGVLDPRIVTWAKDIVAVKCIVQRGRIAEKEHKAEQLKRIRIELGIAKPHKRRKQVRKTAVTIDQRARIAKQGKARWAKLKAEDPVRYAATLTFNRERWAKYYAAHRDEVNARKREQPAARRDEVNTKQRERWARLKKENPEQYAALLQQRREYAAAHRDEIKRYCAARYAKAKANRLAKKISPEQSSQPPTQ